MTLPYKRTLLTKALMSYILTLTFDMPNIRQLVYTALKTRLAADNLASISISGLTDAFEIYRPKYLNFCTVSIFIVRT
jgi:hypothetical protein